VSGVVSHGVASARVAFKRCALSALFALMAAGCSLTLPFEDRGSALQADPEVTGSIAPRAPREPELQPGQLSPFSPQLDAEDWRRQRAALATALDPQGNGGNVRWDNPDSGARGSFSPVGNAFLIKHDICRIFIASVALKAPEQMFQGSACRNAPGEWLVRDIQPWKKSG
jgi:surface antigen